MPDLLGLHHLTATVDETQADVDFYARTLGMRLVKQTVNFDNPAVYHFYYGDRTGTPGSIMTTFPYGGHAVALGQIGTGQVTETAFAVPRGSLDVWRERLPEATPAPDRFGDVVLAVRDPSGLRLELIESDADAETEAQVWDAQVPADAAVRGLHSVTLRLRDAAPTARLLSDVLGFEPAGSEGPRTRFTLGAGGARRTLDLVEDPDGEPGRNGLGTVHHVAFAVPDADAQARIADALRAAGLRPTDVRDRQYFRSVYCREPGGVLFEFATAAPGFLIDEPEDALGTALRLPPWEESRRAQIEPLLSPITLP